MAEDTQDGDDLTLKYERVAKIMKVATINLRLRELCAALRLGWSIGAPSRAARQEKYERCPRECRQDIGGIKL